jgi:hypothetical protein
LGAVVEGVTNASYFLIGLMAFAGDQNEITGLGQHAGGTNGLSPVADAEKIDSLFKP